METHEGALLGGDPATLRERCQAASPAYRIRETMCPLLILHGDKDPLVPFAVSQDFYERLQAAGLGDRVELVTVKNAGPRYPGVFSRHPPRSGFCGSSIGL